VQHARQTLADTRAKVMLALLPAWQTLVTQMPGTPTEVAARRSELAMMFGPAANKATPLYVEFKAPLDARESALSQQLAAEDQARLQQAQNAAAVAAAGPGGAGVMRSGDLKRPGTMGGKLLGAIFQGEFDQVQLEPGSWELSALVGGYINAFSSQCRKQIGTFCRAHGFSAQQCAWQDDTLSHLSDQIVVAHCSIQLDSHFLVFSIAWRNVQANESARE
jgi:hypothetical protein